MKVANATGEVADVFLESKNAEESLRRFNTHSEMRLLQSGLRLSPSTPSTGKRAQRGRW